MISTRAWTSSHSLLPSQGLQKHPQKHCMVKMHVPGHRVLLENSSATIESISEIDSIIDFKRKLRKGECSAIKKTLYSEILFHPLHWEKTHHYNTLVVVIS